MATASTRVLTVTFTGDVSFQNTAQAAGNASSPGSEQLLTLAAGDNVLTIPATGALATAVTIVKPSGNTVLIKLKGTGGDVGIALNKTDPDSISFDPSITTIILNAATPVNVRLLWS